jgi:hypothetical protein
MIKKKIKTNETISIQTPYQPEHGAKRFLAVRALGRRKLCALRLERLADRLALKLNCVAALKHKLCGVVLLNKLII